MAVNTSVTIKAINDDTVRIAGYGVVFGGVDLDGETFGPDTDYMLDLVPEKLVLYDHGMNGAVKGSIIGRIKADDIAADDDGIWIEAELSRHAAYVEQIMKLAEAGALGWSSGSVGHLVARAGKSIKRWPIVEFSLTPTPAEPRTLGVEVLKSLADAAPALAELSAVESTVDIDESEAQPEPEAGEPEDARSASAPAAKAADDDSIDDNAFEAQRLALEIEILEMEYEL